MKVIRGNPDPRDCNSHTDSHKCELFSQIFCLREGMARHFDVERVIPNENLYRVVSKLDSQLWPRNEITEWKTASSRTKKLPVQLG